MQQQIAIVIGSGVGGMAIAIRLAVKGYAVSVYEKNSTPGGKLSAFEKDGFHFDAGPSLFTQPQNVKDLFELAGEDINKYLQYKPVDIACKYFYENGKQINAYTNTEKFANELHQQVNEQPAKTIKYLQNAEKIYNNIGTVFLNHSLHKRKTWIHKRAISALKSVKYNLLFSSLHKHNAGHFKTIEATQIFDRFATYNGSNPYKAPAMLSLIPHLEQNEGTFYPTGGMISITNALYNLAKKVGVQFYFNAPVQRIIHHNNKIQGIVVNNKNLPAKIVVSNVDVYFTYKNLLQNELLANKVLKQERSSSAVIFYWGIKKQFSQLQLHNIFFSQDYKTEFAKIFDSKEIAIDPTIYINITSKIEPTQSPTGTENWFVMVNVPANLGQNWQELKVKIKAFVIDKLSRMLNEPDLASLIVNEHTLDPFLIEEQTASYMGSLYGTSSNSVWAAFLRHANFKSTIVNLYFCGGSVHPGGGIPLCLKSAKIVSDLVSKK
jgi:phytoene desaturase